MTTELQTKIEAALADVGSTVESDKVERMVLPDGPWRRWWQGSGPERGDHVMLGRSHIAYFPAPDGTLGLHHEVGRIIYEHNCAVEKMADLLRECAAEIERLEKSRRALRNRLISEMQSNIDGPYELRVARAEAKANEFEEHFEKAMGWK